MSLAAALQRVPKNIRVTGGYALSETMKPAPGPVQAKRRGPKGLPCRYVRDAGMIYAIGQICTRVSWFAIAAWIHQQSGIELSMEGVRLRVINHAQGRSREMRAQQHAEVAAYYIVCKLHGMKQPWPHIAEQVSAKRGTHKPYRRVCLDTLAYMRKVLEDA